MSGVEIYTKQQVDALLEGAGIVEPSSPTAHRYFNKRHNWSSQIFRAGSRIADLTVDIEITAPSLLTTSGRVNFEHKNIAPGAVFVSSRIGYRRYADQASMPTFPTGARSEPLWQNSAHPITWVPGSKDGGNIRDVTQHYGCTSLDSMINLTEAGWYRFEVWAFSGTDSAGYSTRDDLITVNRDTNQVETDTFGYFGGVVMPLGERII